ncbi:dipeptidase [candidate division CSSED10-310 bacterium]|uniref:Dipeptidase n=1 Tax=candidate division CSSED10-310 bacterium TaxID=2855610 RepID=A0ABV6Z202_UNCC1
MHILVCLNLCLAVIFGCDSNSSETIESNIHEQVLTVDSHVDTPYFLFHHPDFDLSKWHDPYETNSKLDFPRMQQGALDAAFFAIWVAQGPRTVEGNENAKQRALDMATLIHDNLFRHEHLAELAITPDDAYRLEQEGKRAIFIGLENGYPIGNELSLVETFFDLGVRYITLCHTRNNDICDSSTDPNGPEHGGLSQFGFAVVREMNRLGVMVDVSHISDDAFFDVLNCSTVPVIASHSNARALYDHPRNIDDLMIVKLAENGGVIQVNFYYLNEPDPHHPDQLATVSDMVDHIDHIVSVAGVDYVGIGSDFDGGGQLADCFDVSEMPNITRELIQRGYTEKEIQKIWGGNLMRVMSEVLNGSRSRRTVEVN